MASESEILTLDTYARELPETPYVPEVSVLNDVLINPIYWLRFSIFKYSHVGR